MTSFYGTGKNVDMHPNKKTARLAGFLWLLMILFGLFAQMGVRERIYIPGDATATAANISANQFLFRLGYLSELTMNVCFLLTALVLYKLLGMFSKNQGRFMVILVIIGTSIGMLNLLNEFASFYVLSGTKYLSVFETDQLQALSMLFYDLYENGYFIGHIFYSLWVLPLGLLIYRSGIIPRILGIAFWAETCVGLLSAVIHFLSPNAALETNLMWVGAFAEFSFMQWLLIRGINEQKGQSAGHLDSAIGRSQ
jgi:hypothetical protein